MKKRTIVCIVMVFVMIFTIAAGCTKTMDTSQDTTTKIETTQKETTQAQTEAKPEPITFTLFNPDMDSDWDNNESPVAKAIIEKTGVTIEVEYGVGDVAEKLSLMVASGDYPDFMAAKDMASMFVEAGAFLDLTPYIEKFGTNIKNLYGDFLKRHRWSMEDKSIYYLGCFPVNEKPWVPTCGFELQHSVVKELGYPRIRTVEDFGNAIKTYMDKYPTIDGQPTIGISQCAEDWRIIISVLDPAAAATGKVGDDGEWVINQDTLNATYHHTRPEEKIYYKWLNNMYNTGVLDPETFIQKFDQYEAKVTSGRVLGLTDARWEFSGMMATLIQDGKPERTYGMYPVTISEDIPYMDGTFYSGGYSAGWGVAITTKCKDPERAFKYLEWLASDEAQILNMWGIEGVNYNIVDGKRVISPEQWEKRRGDPEFKKSTGIDVHIWPFPQRGKGDKDSTGQYYNPLTPEQDIDNYLDIEKEVLAGYGAKMWRDLYPQDFPTKKYGLGYQINIPNESEAMVFWTKCEEIVWKRVPELVMAKPSEFDALWDTYQKELLDAGVRQFEEEYNKLLQARIKMYND